MNERVSRTDWDRVDSLQDEAIDTSDIPPLTEAFFEHARLHQRRQRVTVAVTLDQDVLTWFQAQGDDWERRVNAALRLYAEIHQAASSVAAVDSS